MIELIAFLGNPGREYEKTRHNAGRRLAERLPFYGDLFWQHKFGGRCASLDRAALSSVSLEAPGRWQFVIPEEYMNNSGGAIRSLAAFYKIPPERILAVHDELEMPLGVAGFKFGGGLGGHNGLRSIKAAAGTQDFWRLRIGIGRPGDREPGKGGHPDRHGDIFGWVLSAFSREEEEILLPVLDAAAQALCRALAEGAEKLLPEWNKKRLFPRSGEDSAAKTGGGTAGAEKLPAAAENGGRDGT